MRLRNFFVLALIFVLPLLAVSAYADGLQGDGNYAVLAQSGITNASAGGVLATTINGDIGLSPIAATACTGFVPCDLGSGIVNGTANLTNAAAANAILAFSGATGSYNTLRATGGAIAEGTATLGTGGSLSSLAPGVYSFTGTGGVTNLLGTLTLAGDGNANDTWIFEFLGSDTLITGTNSSVVVNGAGTGAGVYFVADQITLGPDFVGAGNYLSGTSVTFATGAQINCGRAFGQTAVTFAGSDPTAPNQINQVSIDSCSAGTGGSTTGLNNGGGGTVSAPEPGTFAFLSCGLAFGLLMFRKLR